MEKVGTCPSQLDEAETFPTSTGQDQCASTARQTYRDAWRLSPLTLMPFESIGGRANGRKGLGMDIVVGFIFGTEARSALECSIGEARAHDARLIVVHSSKGGPHETNKEVLEYSDALARINEELATAGIEHEVQELVLGCEPAEDIVRIAREKRAEMIVIGLHRRSRVGKFILGSTAQDILLAADCPVLAVK